MKDFLESLKGNISDRLNNPFLSSFLIALVILNYKFFFVLFSDDDYNSKFYYIDYVLHDDSYWFIFKTIFLWPLLTAAFYTFVWPALDVWISYFSQLISNWKKKKLLSALRAETVAKEEQEEYFRNYDQKILAAQKEYEHYKGLFISKNEELNKYKQISGKLLNRGALQRLALSAGIEIDEAVRFINRDNSSFRSQINPETNKLASSEILKRLYLLTKEIKRSAPKRQDQAMLKDTEWLSISMDLGLSETEDMIDILLMLKIVDFEKDMSGRYSINHALSDFNDLTAKIEFLHNRDAKIQEQSKIPM